MIFHSTYLREEHDVAGFDCGIDDLNSWLRCHALHANRADIARTYVWTSGPDTAAVMAYFSFAPTAVVREELSAGQAGGQLGLIPGYLLARLALDKSLTGQGLGTELLLDAIGRLVGASEVAAGRLIVADAIDDRAARFYIKHDFTPVIGTPRRPILKMKTARNLMNVS